MFFVKALAHKPIFCRRTANLLSGSDRVKICWVISLPYSNRFFVASNCVETWGRVVQNQDGAYSTHVPLEVEERASLDRFCLGPPYTGRQGLTRPDKKFSDLAPRSCRRLVWILPTLAEKWRFSVGRQKIGQCAAAFKLPDRHE